MLQSLKSAEAWPGSPSHITPSPPAYGGLVGADFALYCTLDSSRYSCFGRGTIYREHLRA